MWFRPGKIVTPASEAIATFASPKLIVMSRIFIFTMIVKAVLLALGILAWYGKHWAFGLFVVIAVMAILFDALMALVANSADKDIEREES